METRYRPILESLVPRDPLTQFHLRRGSPDDEFPDLCRNSTWMGRILTPAMYRRQFDRCTHSGVMFDDVIRPGLEEPGDWSGPVSVGCVAGDAQSYILFCDFFDRVIEAHHDHKIQSQTPESDFNYDNLKRLEDEELPGRLVLIEELNQEQQRELNLNPSSTQLRTGMARDWPDARAVWVSNDGSLMVWVNMDDHLRLVSTRDDTNITEAFKCICIQLQKLEGFYRELRHPFIWKQQLGWVTSSPADVGTGLRIRVQLKLQHLPKQRRLQDVLKRLRICMDRPDADVSPESPALYRVSNVATFGVSEVDLTQLVVDGVKLLIAMEKRLEGGGDIDDLVPTQK
ncbi:Creatine kinase M-type [Collichthys lucidus]|uniref:creatine kinase n=1 Tax=Collichthys lucidus TaxID=240159 RepID=A0A4U5U4X6_COLLU|nr:Creatine kinase M-type [Collichthys lucidus]